MAARKEVTPSVALSRLRVDPATGTIYYYTPGRTVYGASAIRVFKREMKAALAKESANGEGKDKA